MLFSHSELIICLVQVMFALPRMSSHGMMSTAGKSLPYFELSDVKSGLDVHGQELNLEDVLAPRQRIPARSMWPSYKVILDYRYIYIYYIECYGKLKRD